MAKVYSVVVTYNAGGQFAQNVLHYQSSETGAFDPVVWSRELLLAFQTAHRTHLRALLPTDTSILSYRSRRVSSPGGATSLLNETIGTGTFGGNVETAGMSAAIEFPVVIGTKNVTGKFYCPGVPSGAWADSQLQPTFATAMTNFGQGLLTPLTGSVSGSTFTFGVLRRQRTTPPVVEAFTAAVHFNLGLKPINIKRRNVPF